MRRPAGLAVDTAAAVEKTNPNADAVILVQSPVASTNTLNVTSTLTVNTFHSPDPPAYVPPTPSIRLLFSLLTRRDLFVFVLPAILLSAITGGIAPFMTIVIGQSFNAFAAFPQTPNPPESAKHDLLKAVGLAAIELVGLAAGALALSSITSSLWIWAGERNAMSLRKRVYNAITRKEMIWFDTKMGGEGSVQDGEESQGPVGAGGLMAQFAKETDEVRMASSLASGMFIQHLTTTVTALILAFTHSWSLTLVILSAVPVLVLIQGVVTGLVNPNLNEERHQTTIAATLVDRAVAAIATVKAFNAQQFEADAIGTVLDRMRAAAKRCNSLWAVSSGLSQFTMMAMFVQGFWFGGKLVRDGSASAGDVMTVFWACLISTSNLQMCLPQLVVLTKGKVAMASLLRLVEEPVEAPVLVNSASTLYTPLSTGVKLSKNAATLRRITPPRCEGEFVLHDVTFAYPSRPSVAVLKDVSLYLPAGETTFIVGGSGSGKSTIAQLLLRMYLPQHGSVQLDDQELAFLDDAFLRDHVAAVSQTCILFDATVHENVAMGLVGRRPEEVSREEVVEACRAALMHEFVRDLPGGYDTRLGNGGANLSGGQKQRLAIARARLRNPSILILDEATSALDATSRLLVFEAIKRWRQNKTTIVITHDLSQIESEDFVYVLKHGRVVEQGYRGDLEATPGGEFQEMAEAQGAMGGLPEKDTEAGDREREMEVEAILEQHEARKDVFVEDSKVLKHMSAAKPSLRPVTMGNWMFDAIADLTKGSVTEPTKASVAARDTYRVSRFVPPEAFSQEMVEDRPRRPSSLIFLPDLVPPPAALSRKLSLQFTPTSPSFKRSSWVEIDEDFEEEKEALERSGTQAHQKREKHGEGRLRARWDDEKLAELKSIKVERPTPEQTDSKVSPASERHMSLFQTIRAIYPSIPYKPIFFLGVLVSLISGAMTPIFSFLLSRLLYEVSIGAQNISTINLFGGIVLSIAAADGLFMGLKFFIMETLAMSWVTSIRKVCLRLVLNQDKKWFDKTDNSSVRLMSILIKDGDDARSLIATVIAQCMVVTSMLSVGLIWALARGWQYTLVGLGLAPVFVITMAIQTNLVAKAEYRNKRAREDVAKTYYDIISNIRGIRSMGFEKVFQVQFEKTVGEALSTGVRGAFVEGCTYGVASSLIYLAEALLFYIGAVFIAKGIYTYLQMIETLQLIVFTVTLGSQLMSFTNRIAKSVQATNDFNRLLQLSSVTDESRGLLRPTIEGGVAFKDVAFSYPERPEAPVLKDVSFSVAEGECVAIVGASGSGKSTIATLLQRLYEPAVGSITIGTTDVGSMDVNHLREHVAVVSQNPNLFDASVRENIAYGAAFLTDDQIRQAALGANVDEFISMLPKGYDTMVGENAALISGGQAQRISIARALARPSKVLILDECTSALDSANQAAVVETIRSAKIGRTTLMVTHKLPLMRMCDRILVVDEGAIVEDGPYEDLMARNGAFARLASAGEWLGE
ncbi:P-loop containing nucleoside triphosphate hydrolase protein [Heliocybe sulcata]|uniref:P-loop containing nucleoside triphosphate hydrolase protein n=1 Tax=Heliocybe sulcata TaxID=5364 RepID=A0A5C3N746_9AGAM|nr:P-loop containing nucleoside triphosphate hydrolase protein [Heliocybe sulcata]